MTPPKHKRKPGEGPAWRRPPTAWSMFLKEQVGALRAPGVTHADATRLAKERWHALPESGKQVYRELALRAPAKAPHPNPARRSSQAHP